jgi:hypothetical protein
MPRPAGIGRLLPDAVNAWTRPTTAIRQWLLWSDQIPNVPSRSPIRRAGYVAGDFANLGRLPE